MATAGAVGTDIRFAAPVLVPVRVLGRLPGLVNADGERSWAAHSWALRILLDALDAESNMPIAVWGVVDFGSDGCAPRVLVRCRVPYWQDAWPWK